MQDDTTNTNEVEEVVADESQPEEVLQEENLQEEVEQTAEEAPEQTQEAESEAEPEKSEESEEKPPSRREQLRIQTLLRKYGPPESRPAPSQQPERGIDYAKELEADDETIQRLQTDRNTVAQSSYSAGLEQAKIIKFETRLEVDEPTVHNEYKWLNPKDKTNFDPVRADAMNTLYLDTVGYDAGDPSKGIPPSVANPNIRYRDFVEAQLEFARALLVEEKAKAVKNVARQAATTGLRPDGSSARAMNLNKAPQEMSMEELYAAIGQKPPKK